jgi:hypothetical protein
MLGLEHVASRGSISIEYYGRDVGIKIMPTGVKPERFLNGFGWQDTIWRRGELLSQASAPELHVSPQNTCVLAEGHSVCKHLSYLKYRMPQVPGYVLWNLHQQGSIFSQPKHGALPKDSGGRTWLC